MNISPISVYPYSRNRNLTAPLNQNQNPIKSAINNSDSVYFTGRAKTSKTEPVFDRALQIADKECYIVGEYLTLVSPDKSSNGCFILDKNKKPTIYMLPDGTLTTPMGDSAEPAMAVDVIKDEIRKIDKKNHTTEEQIENLDSAIKAKKADTDEKVADLETKAQSLTVYFEKLKANSSALENISKEDLRPICDKFFEIEEYTDSWQITSQRVKFDKEKVGKELCRILASEQAISLLDVEEQAVKLLDIKEFVASQEQKSPDVAVTLLDKVTDVDSLLGILSAKRKLLVKNNEQLNEKKKEAQDTDKACDYLFNSALTNFNKAKDYCLGYEREIRSSICKTIEDCQKDAQHDYVWLVGYERFKDYTYDEKLYIRNAGNYNMATSRNSTVEGNHCGREECKKYRALAEKDYKAGLRPTTGWIDEYIYANVKDLKGQRAVDRREDLHIMGKDGGLDFSYHHNPWHNT